MYKADHFSKQISSKKPKYFAPLTARAKSIPFAVFDIEAADWTDFKVIGLYDGSETHFFDNIPDFFRHIESDPKYRGLVIYAHNAVNYDFRFLYPHIEKTVDMFSINGDPVEIAIMRDDYTATGREKRIPKKAKTFFRDSFKLFPASLARLGSALNVEIQKGEMDYSKIGYNPETLTYVERDLISTYQVIEKGQELLRGLGASTKITLAATARDLFRRKYLTDNLPTYFWADEWIRKSYFGGRTEVFNRLGHELYSFDFNSLYPAVMRENRFPVGIPVYYRGDPGINPHTDFGFAKIDCVIPKNIKIPPLPVKTNGMIIYPTGEITGYYAFPFLALLRDMGIPYRVRSAMIFGGGKKLFSEYVNDLYRVRLENPGTAVNFIAKLMMNSLYGGFGMRSDKELMFMNPTVDEIRDLNLSRYDEHADIWVHKYNLFSKASLIAIASYVTTYAQVKLYREMADYRGRICYCDTDSIYGDAELPESTELGGLKKEKEILRAAFMGQKMYSGEESDHHYFVKFKGLPRGIYQYRERDFFENMVKAIRTNDFSYFAFRFHGLYGWKESLIRSRKNRCDTENPFLLFGGRKKSVLKVDTKRVFDGENTRPFHMVNGELT